MLSHRLPAARETEVKVELCMAGRLQRCAVTILIVIVLNMLNLIYWHCLTTKGRVAVHEGPQIRVQ